MTRTPLVDAFNTIADTIKQLDTDEKLRVLRAVAILSESGDSTSSRIELLEIPTYTRDMSKRAAIGRTDNEAIGKIEHLGYFAPTGEGPFATDVSIVANCHPSEGYPKWRIAIAEDAGDGKFGGLVMTTRQGRALIQNLYTAIAAIERGCPALRSSTSDGSEVDVVAAAIADSNDDGCWDRADEGDDDPDWYRNLARAAIGALARLHGPHSDESAKLREQLAAARGALEEVSLGYLRGLDTIRRQDPNWPPYEAAVARVEALRVTGGLPPTKPTEPGRD